MLRPLARFCSPALRTVDAIGGGAGPAYPVAAASAPPPPQAEAPLPSAVAIDQAQQQASDTVSRAAPASRAALEAEIKAINHGIDQLQEKISGGTATPDDVAALGRSLASLEGLLVRVGQGQDLASLRRDAVSRLADQVGVPPEQAAALVEKLDVEKLTALIHGVDDLTAPNVDMKTRAMGVVQLLQSVPEGYTEKLFDRLKGPLEKLGADRVALGHEDGQLTLTITMVGDKDRGGEITAGYNPVNGEFSVGVRAGVYGRDDEGELRAEATAAVRYSYSENGYDPSEAAYSRGPLRVADLPEGLRDRLRAEAERNGQDVDNSQVYLQINADKEGNVSVGVVFDAQEPGTGRHHVVEMAIEANASDLAADAAGYLAKKYGPELAASLGARVGVAGLTGVSKAIPVVGQAITAAQIGWAAGRMLGENVMVDGRNLDQLTEEAWRDQMDGTGRWAAADEEKFKATVGAVGMTAAKEIEALPANDPRRPMLERMRDLRTLEVVAVSRADLLTTTDREAAMAEIAKLEEAGAISPPQAHVMRAHFGAARKPADDPAISPEAQEGNAKRISADFDQVNRRSGRSGALENARQHGAEVTRLLRHGEISPDQAAALFTQMEDTLAGRGIPRDEAQRALRDAISGPDAPDRSTTPGVEVLIARRIEEARLRLRVPSS